MIAGHEAWICGDCVAVCAHILAAQTTSQDSGSTNSAVCLTIARPRNSRARVSVDEVVTRLGQREKVVLSFRLGAGTAGRRTLEETAAHFGLTIQEVRQIEASAMSLARAPM